MSHLQNKRSIPEKPTGSTQISKNFSRLKMKNLRRVENNSVVSLTT